MTVFSSPWDAGKGSVSASVSAQHRHFTDTKIPGITGMGGDNTDTCRHSGKIAQNLEPTELTLTDTSPSGPSVSKCQCKKSTLKKTRLARAGHTFTDIFIYLFILDTYEIFEGLGVNSQIYQEKTLPFTDTSGMECPDGCKVLLLKLPADTFGRVVTVDDVPVVTVESPKAFMHLTNLITSGLFDVVALDTETTGLDPWKDRLTVIQIFLGGVVWVIDVAKVENNDLVRDTVACLLGDKSICKVIQNAKFDLKFLLRWLWTPQKGQKCLVPASRVRAENIFDTFLAEHVLTAGIANRGQHNLRFLAAKYTRATLEKGAVRTSFLGEGLTDDQLAYAARDVIYLPAIKEAQVGALREQRLISVARMEMECVQPLAEMELHGLVLDRAALKAMTDKLVADCHRLEREVFEIAGRADFNLRSPAQVTAVLASLGHPVSSTAAGVLETIDHPFARKLLEHREASKALSSFAEALKEKINPVTGRIHPEFNQMGTQTGRLSCKNPNLQQIPADQEWRDLFVAPAGYLVVTADYSQIELRILAQVSKDPVFLDAYDKGQDLHTRTAAEMFKLPLDAVPKEKRNVAKVINFGLIYGMTSQGLADRLHISKQEADDFVRNYFSSYPGVEGALQKMASDAVREKYSLTLSGRKRFYPPITHSKDIGSIQRRGKNSPIQGTCGDILKTALPMILDAFRLIGVEAWVANNVHDEVVVMVPEDKAEELAEVVNHQMALAGKKFLPDVPVVVEHNIGKVWKK